jgi:pyruvate ferredoxin oxidoreductase alpha subunit
MVCQDGFLVSHTLEPVELLPDAEVETFVGRYQAPEPLLDLEHPVTLGALTLPDAYFEHKIRQAAAFTRARTVLEEVGAELSAWTGRPYGAVDRYRMEGAERALLLLGSACGTVKEVVDRLREAGEPVGALGLRCFRPFPARELERALAGVSALGVLDRAMAFGTGAGPVFSEVRAALAGSPNAPGRIQAFVYGLGGRDFGDRHAEEAFAKLRGTPASIEEGGTLYLNATVEHGSRREDA